MDFQSAQVERRHREERLRAPRRSGHNGLVVWILPFLLSFNAIGSTTFQWLVDSPRLEPTEFPAPVQVVIELASDPGAAVLKTGLRFYLIERQGLRLSGIIEPEPTALEGLEDSAPSFPSGSRFGLILAPAEGASSLANAPLQLVIEYQGVQDSIEFLPARATLLLNPEEFYWAPASKSEPAHTAGADLPSPEGTGEIRALAPEAPKQPQAQPSQPAGHPRIRETPPNSLLPFALMMGLLSAGLLGLPSPQALDLRASGRMWGMITSLAIGLGLLSACAGFAMQAIGAQSATTIVLSALACAGIGARYWLPHPFPPWPKGHEPRFPEPDLDQNPFSRGAWSSIARAFLRIGLPLLGVVLFGFGLQVKPLRAGTATLIYLIGAWLPAAVSQLTGKPLPQPRYLSSAIGLAFLSASLYLWVLRLPILAPPVHFPFAMFLSSLILMVVGIMLGGLDRPLLSRRAGTVGAKLAGTILCILGFYFLLAGLDAAPPDGSASLLPPSHEFTNRESRGLFSEPRMPGRGTRMG